MTDSERPRACWKCDTCLDCLRTWQLYGGAVGQHRTAIADRIPPATYLFFLVFSHHSLHAVNHGLKETSKYVHVGLVLSQSQRFLSSHFVIGCSADKV